MGSSTEYDEKLRPKAERERHVEVSTKEVDTAAALLACGAGAGEYDPREAIRIR